MCHDLLHHRVSQRSKMGDSACLFNQQERILQKVCQEALTLEYYIGERKEGESVCMVSPCLPLPTVKLYSLWNYLFYISSCLIWPLAGCAGEEVSCCVGWSFIQLPWWSGSGSRWDADSERAEESDQGLYPIIQYCH